MSNIKQQKKRILTDQKRYLANRHFISMTRTALKQANLAILEESVADAQIKVNYAIQLLDKLFNKRIRKMNFISRNKSRLFKKFSLKQKENLNKTEKEITKK